VPPPCAASLIAATALNAPPCAVALLALLTTGAVLGLRTLTPGSRSDLTILRACPAVNIFSSELGEPFEDPGDRRLTARADSDAPLVRDFLNAARIFASSLAEIFSAGLATRFSLPSLELDSEGRFAA
jgi:hypothetical protein